MFHAPRDCLCWVDRGCIAGMQGMGRQVNKAEVDAIVQDHFNIDPSNPIICLTQVLYLLI